METIVENKENEKVIVAGVYETADEKTSEEDFRHSMTELEELAAACNMQSVGMITQQLDHRVTGTYMGAGRLDDVKKMVEVFGAGHVILNDTLTPTQIRNIQDIVKVPVMDRTALILEIFKSRARTRESKLQVELARLQYLKPRLIGMWETQNRQGGASGSMSSKGEGETQLEIDRRTIDHRLAELRKELKIVERERETQRKKRRNSRTPLVALVGYTNAGKSTIMNAFVNTYSKEEKKVFEANMLFATLDTTIRRIETGGGKDFMLSDTVGFIQKLPTSLVEAFKSTLEETKEADLLLHVVDCSDKHYLDHMAATRQTISELGAGDVPTIVVYNKCDMHEPALEYPKRGPERRDEAGRLESSVYISARDDASLSLLREMIIEQVYSDYEEAEFLIPFEKGNIVSYLLEHAHVKEQSYDEKGTRIVAGCHHGDIEKYREYKI